MKNVEAARSERRDSTPREEPGVQLGAETPGIEVGEPEPPVLPESLAQHAAKKPLLVRQPLREQDVLRVETGLGR